MINKNFQPFNDKVEEPLPELPERKREEDEDVHIPISELPVDDRPREKLLARGVEALTNAELFAILIGMGTKKKTAVELMQDVLNDCGGKLRNLNRMTIQMLTKYDGIGEAKALTIIAAAELGRRRMNEQSDEIQTFGSSEKVFEFMRHRIQDLAHEESWVLLLNQNTRLIHCSHLSKGGLTETMVDVRMLMKEALMYNATCFVLVHNHPSGSVRPSMADKTLTEKVKKAAMTLNIRMIDHVIVAENDYYSFAENGQL